MAVPVAKDLQIVAVVPCYDEPTVIPLLQSLWGASQPNAAAEVLVLINSRVDDPARVRQRNADLAAEAAGFDAAHGEPRRRVHAIHVNLPSRRAGVGLARKLSMDEALRRLAEGAAGGGVICSLDADCRVDRNYWSAIAEHFGRDPKGTGVSIHFEHDGADTTASPIGRYELYMRYYRHALRWVGHPHAYHTIGSAMAVTGEAYAAVGGMNRRQAGEDFYFLKKLMLRGGFADLTTTTVRPSGRVSDRVPFGTGRAVQRQAREGGLLVPDVPGFAALQPLLAQVRDDTPPEVFLQGLDLSLQEFLKAKGIDDKIAEIRANTASRATYEARFFAWFDGLRVRQWLNIWCAGEGRLVPVETAARRLQERLNPSAACPSDAALVRYFRSLDKCADLSAPRFSSQRR